MEQSWLLILTLVLFLTTYYYFQHNRQCRSQKMVVQELLDQAMTVNDRLQQQQHLQQLIQQREQVRKDREQVVAQRNNLHQRYKQLKLRPGHQQRENTYPTHEQQQVNTISPSTEQTHTYSNYPLRVEGFATAGGWKSISSEANDAWCNKYCDTTPQATQCSTLCKKTGTGNCSKEYEQCGGKGWTGSTCCQSGCGCTAQGEWYSQCVPESGWKCNMEEATPTPSTPTPSTPTPSTPTPSSPTPPTPTPSTPTPTTPTPTSPTPTTPTPTSPTPTTPTPTTTPTYTPSGLPIPIKGYYLWTWNRHAGTDPAVSGPPGSNIGITFPGAKASGNNGAWLEALANPPQTNNQINLLSVGGGAGQDGPQSFNTEDITKLNNLMPKIKQLGFHGICYDLESGNATIDEYKSSMKRAKSLGLIVMVTTSYFAAKWAPEPFPSQIDELVQTTLTKSEYVDILSPQLYSANCGEVWTGTAGGGDWNGINKATQDAYKKCKFVAPSINSGDWTTMKAIWVGLGLPEPIGVFQYCNKSTNVIIPTT